jgi:hypothetical protein
MFEFGISLREMPRASHEWRSLANPNAIGDWRNLVGPPSFAIDHFAGTNSPRSTLALRQLSLDMPSTVLARADEVTENERREFIS